MSTDCKSKQDLRSYFKNGGVFFADTSETLALAWGKRN